MCKRMDHIKTKSMFEACIMEACSILYSLQHSAGSYNLVCRLVCNLFHQVLSIIELCLWLVVPQKSVKTLKVSNRNEVSPFMNDQSSNSNKAPSIMGQMQHQRLCDCTSVFVATTVGYLI